MTQNDRNKKVEDFERYLADEMSAAERNAFEKELQKNDFEAEALEGFEAIQTDISGDLKELHNKIDTGKPKRKLHYWAAAATILLLISSGIIWMQLSVQNPIQQTAETKVKTEKKTLAKIAEPKDSDFEKELAAESKETSKQVLADKIPTEPIRVKKSAKIQNNKSEVQEPARVVNIEEQTIQAAPPQAKAQRTQIAAKPMEVEDLAQINIAKVISGQVVSADNKTPIPGASIIEKGTTNGTITDIDGNFSIQLESDSNTALIAQFIGMEQKEIAPSVDSNNYIELANDNIGLDDVVVVGFGTQKKKQTVGSISAVVKPENANASPSCGMVEYNRILNDNAILPNDYSDKKRVVKLLLSIDEKGAITKIENINKADQELVKLASEIINEAPPWNSKIVNGVNVASEIKLKIEFTKR